MIKFFKKFENLHHPKVLKMTDIEALYNDNIQGQAIIETLKIVVDEPFAPAAADLIVRSI